MAGELILIIEDNEKNRKLSRDVLEVSGYRTLETDTGEEGVRLAREHEPALVLLDIHLPGIDGIETFQRLRADPATAAIPVIAVTASAMPDDRARIKAVGFDRYLSKPINIKSFLETVGEVLGANGASP
ncbi:MAG: response regulator [Gammaproteobacteria bacterium]|nr:response regulator [Gammaproteobacteria bacterium]